MSFEKIATNNPITVFSLVIVVITLGMVKEWIADRKRQKEDKRVNLAKFTKLVDVEQRTPSKDGDNSNWDYKTETVFC